MRPLRATCRTPETARARADAADLALKRGEVWGPLHGLPITIKESHNFAGGLAVDMRKSALEAQSPGRNRGRDRARLLDAGATIFGKTNVPIGLLDWQSYNAIHVRPTIRGDWAMPRAVRRADQRPRCRDRRRSLSAIELGSDSGGSIRFPAHYTGLFGHRPSIGIVPSEGNQSQPITVLSSNTATKPVGENSTLRVG